MAARLTNRCADQTRDTIKTSLLVKKLQDHNLEGAELSATQIKAAEILLRKTLPDLKVTEHTGELAHTFPENVGVIGMVDDGPGSEDTS